MLAAFRSKLYNAIIKRLHGADQYMILSSIGEVDNEPELIDSYSEALKRYNQLNVERTQVHLLGISMTGAFLLMSKTYEL